MRITYFSTLGFLLAALVLVGCASSQPETQEATTERTCVRVDQINSYSVIDNRHIFVNVTGKDNYMFTVDQGCPGLTFAQGISIADRSSRVCGDGSGLLAFNQPGVGIRRCRIIKIDTVTNEAAAKALIPPKTDE